MGTRNAGNPHVACDAAGTGNVAWLRYCDTRRRKSEITGNTNIGLNRRASPRPYYGRVLIAAIGHTALVDDFDMVGVTSLDPCNVRAASVLCERLDEVS
jgi:hypothetical protein